MADFCFGRFRPIFDLCEQRGFDHASMRDLLGVRLGVPDQRLEPSLPVWLVERMEMGNRSSERGLEQYPQIA